MTKPQTLSAKSKRIVLGLEPPTTDLESMLISNLSRHNTGLRENAVAALFNFEVTKGSKGMSDMRGWLRQRFREIDLKHGLEMRFIDGMNTWGDKSDWVCFFCHFAPGGLAYIIMCEVSDCIVELEESARKLRGKSGRKHPTVAFSVWSKKPSTRVLYKNVDLFERYKRTGWWGQEGDFKHEYGAIDALPYSSAFDDFLPNWFKDNTRVQPGFHVSEISMCQLNKVA
jgi:hypothetical protein